MPDWLDHFKTVDINEESATGLTRQLWRFYLMNDGFHLVHYSVQTRLHRRGTWVVQVRWDSLLPDESTVKPKDIPITASIKAKLRAELTNRCHDVPIQPPSKRP